MIKSFDAVIVLGTRFDKNWQLREDLTDRLDLVSDMYHSGEVKKILVSGKWTIWYDWLKITPPTTEARLMKDYLVRNGVAHKDIVQEIKSKDTIGNVYYCGKILQDKPQSFTRVAIVCASQRIERVRFITEQLFDKRLEVEFILVDAPNDSVSSLGVEEDIFTEQKTFIMTLEKSLKQSKVGMYHLPYYTMQSKAVRDGR